MQWYYAKNGVQMGPVGIDELRAKIASGEIAVTDMVWREGMPDWRRAAEVQELALAQVSPQQVVPQPTPGPANSPYTPPTATPGYAAGGVIPNYLWQSIVVTIFCCWPLGIPAIVYAAKVDGMRARGDIAGAVNASNTAKMWCLISLGAWLLLVVCYILFFVVVGVSSSSSHQSF